jgi:hypothetical protein
MPGLNKLCIPDTIVYQNLSTGGQIFEWDLGDGTRIVKTDTSRVMHPIDPGTCKVRDSASIKVDIFLAQGKVQEDDALCLGNAYQLKASGAQQYFWRSADGTFQSNLPSPVVTPEDTTRYFVTLIEASGCLRKDTVDLVVITPIVPEFEIDRSDECFNRPNVMVKNLTDSLWEGDHLYFDFGDGVTSDQMEVEHEFKRDGLYTVKLVATREFCVTEEVVQMPVFKLLIPNVITPSLRDEANDTFTVQMGDEKGVTPAEFGFKTTLAVFNRWGEKVYDAPDYQYNWDGGDLPAGIYYYEISIDDHATCKSWLHLVK